MPDGSLLMQWRERIVQVVRALTEDLGDLLCHRLPMRQWASHTVSMTQFLLSTMGIAALLCLKGVCEDKYIKI